MTDGWIHLLQEKLIVIQLLQQPARCGLEL